MVHRIGNTECNGTKFQSRSFGQAAKLSCVLIGATALLPACGEAWLGRGHGILAIISDDLETKTWAELHGIEVFALEKNLAARLRNKSFDYMFSVANHAMLSPAIISLPRHLAINYHDSLLPTYAGHHATSWAILSKERKHGVSWHIMETRVDAGDIVAQSEIGIDNHETAQSLNLKCFQAAISTFGSLIGHLECGTLIRETQNPANRSFFTRTHLPPAAGVI